MRSDGGADLHLAGLGQEDPGAGRRVRRPRQVGRAAQADDGQGTTPPRHGILRDEMVRIHILCILYIMLHLIIYNVQSLCVVPTFKPPPQVRRQRQGEPDGGRGEGTREGQGDARPHERDGGLPDARGRPFLRPGRRGGVSAVQGDGAGHQRLRLHPDRGAAQEAARDGAAAAGAATSAAATSAAASAATTTTAAAARGVRGGAGEGSHDALHAAAGRLL